MNATNKKLISIAIPTYQCFSNRAAPQRDPIEVTIYEPDIKIPFDASDGIGCVKVIVKGRETAKIGN